MKSRFAGVFEARKKIDEAELAADTPAEQGRELQPAPSAPPAPAPTIETPAPIDPIKLTEPIVKPAPMLKAVRKPKPPVALEKRGVGRPPGKRSSEDYQSVTTFIRADIYRQTRIAILEEGNTFDFGDLVEKLLTQWLKQRK